jgi:hypothetical protein
MELHPHRPLEFRSRQQREWHEPEDDQATAGTAASVATVVLIRA